MSKKNIQLNIKAEELKKKLNIKDGAKGDKGDKGETPVIDTQDIVEKASKLAQVALEKQIQAIPPFKITDKDIEDISLDVQSQIEPKFEELKKDIEETKIKAGQRINTGFKAFKNLTDAPHSYNGQAGKVVKVTADETGLEFGVDSDAQDLQSVTDNGATTTNTITAQSFITTGGTSSDFVKGDGSLDSNIYLTSEDLTASLTVYPTTTASDIGGYLKLVTTPLDPDYDEPAVNVTTGTITGTNQLIASLATATGILVGDLGIFNVTTIGNIRKTGGGANANATFHFEIYKRDSGGTETLISLSNQTLPVSSSSYFEFSASALFNDGVFTATDRVVLKFYGTRTGAGADPTFDFQFGGMTPVRTLLPVPVSALLSGYVPYIGATTTVDLNDQDLNSVNTLEVKQTTTNAVIVGDVSGDARGVSALDIQSYRADTTKVASGTHSVAVGFSNTASGYRSTASGYYNTASGTASTALGVNSQATGSESVAIGSGTGSSYYGFDLKTQATGANSVSVGTNSGYFGRGNTASAQYSSAFGIGNSASGYKSSASGYNNTALGEYSSAVGSTNIANGYRSTVLGSSNHAQGEYSYVIGSINTAFGKKSTASGYYNTSSGENSVAFGSSNQSNNTVSGYYGTLGTLAIGFANTASGSGYSGAGIIAVGRDNTASGYLAQAFGGSNTASGVSSLAIGEGNTASALRSIAIGSGIINANSDTLEFGPSNTRKIQISTSAVQPVQTNVQTLGGASNRWSNLFTSKLNVAQDITVARIARTSAYGIATFDFWIDCTANTFAVTFPTAVGVTGKMYIVSNSGTGTITLNTTSSQTISGSASGAITLPQWATITVLSNGANWIKIT